MGKAVIHVSGGVADLAYTTPNIEVYILDFDNAKEYEDMGSYKFKYKCPSCLHSSAQFEWNAATVDTFGPEAIRIQHATDEEFTCPRCYEDNLFYEIEMEMNQDESN
jgi:DNA-directed RNA polymerase subunit M/transcription elongation factor TFIIS